MVTAGMQKLQCFDVGNLGFSRLCETSFILCLRPNPYNKYISQKKEKQQYIAVCTVRIHRTNKHLTIRLIHFPYTKNIARIRCYVMLSTIFKCKDVQYDTVSVYIKCQDVQHTISA